MYDLSFAQNQIKAARALRTLENKKKAGIIKDFSQEDLVEEYKSYHGVVISQEVVKDQEARAVRIGFKKKSK